MKFGESLYDRGDDAPSQADQVRRATIEILQGCHHREESWYTGSRIHQMLSFCCWKSSSLLLSAWNHSNSDNSRFYHKSFNVLIGLHSQYLKFSSRSLRALFLVEEFSFPESSLALIELGLLPGCIFHECLSEVTEIPMVKTKPQPAVVPSFLSNQKRGFPLLKSRG